MRATTIIVAQILFCLAAPVYAGDGAARVSDLSENKQLDEKINEIQKLIETSRKARIAEDAIANESEKSRQTDKILNQLPQGRAEDYFDLTSLSVVCFTLEGRPVCGRSTKLGKSPHDHSSRPATATGF